MRRPFTILITAALALALAAPHASASHAERHNWVPADLPYGLFYGDFATATLFTGGPVESFCDGDPGVAPMRLFLDDHTATFKVDVANQPAYLYDWGGDAIEFLIGVCTGQIVPGLIGDGVVRLKIRDTLTFEGAPSPAVPPIHVDVSNQVVGHITADDGTVWRVRGHADFEVGPDLMPIGDPRDFQDLHLHRNGA